ncbi:hypothetical protein P154DRAFT_517507 [Amniculicola lignicola CBS 123094]|uniref:Centromere protein H C-terminal domain-containing protein n=1 Tax=Amniculicola lignicola CBS 123094 TaxID=1392246 RepID=A0A6A5X2Z8_9PLEO|nr:hypothetical protein P154DRAFT_517507 [Amniculicola lignicola CBS 123094]
MDSNDTPMADAAPALQNPTDYSDLLKTNHADAFAFSAQEELALSLYDQLRDLELQQSLLEAQESASGSDVSVVSEHVLQEQLITAEREAMEARAEYELRNRTTHNVLSMDPVLKAIHGGDATDCAERRILPLVTERDVVSMVHGSIAAKLAATTQTLCTAEKENMAVNQKNSELSHELLALAEIAKAQSIQDIDDPRLREKVTAVERDVKESRSRMRTLKGILSGMIVGSGINWAEDEVLCELVMDEEEDG